MTAKSPTGRFGIFFGLKRRPSSNFQSNHEPSPAAFYNGGTEGDDPFAAHYVPSVDTSPSPSRNLPQTASELEHGLDMDSVYADPPSTNRTRRPAPINVFRPLKADHSEKIDDDHLRVSRNTGTDVLGNPPLTLKHHGNSATSVEESLALAAAIARANGMVLSPDPTTSQHRKSAATEEYPSPPPSDHSSPYPSGIPYHGRTFSEEAEDEDGDVDQSLLVVGSAGNSSLPTTPALIDSFPATPYGPVQPYAPPPLPNSPPDILSTGALPIRSSSRGVRQRAGSTPALWSSSSNGARYNNTDLSDVYDVAEADERQQDFIYPYSLRPLPDLGPPPSVPLPPEPPSPRGHSSALYKHLHQLELDITSLTRKLTTSSSRSGSSQAGSSNTSTSDVPRMLKKSISHSRLQRESSGGSSGISSNQGNSFSASTSNVTIPGSSSQSKMEAALQNAKRHRAFQPNTNVPPMPSLENRSPVAQRPSTASTETGITSPLKLKDKRGSRDKDQPKEDRDGFSKRRFFSKYASMGSHVEKEVPADLSTMIDLEDSHSVTSMQSGATGIPDDEWGANLNLAASSSSLRTQESSINILPVSSASSQKSPIEDLSPLVTPQTPLRSHASPTEYVQHILPPAELLRLERTGFTLDDAVSSRGRELKLGSPLSKSPLGTSPLASKADWERRSPSASRVDNGPFQSRGTRPHRSGSFAVLPSSSTGSSPGSTLQSPSQEKQRSSGRHGFPPRKYSDASILSPPSKTINMRPVTSPSSPVAGSLSLPPPPRPKIKSFRSSGDLDRASDTASIVSGGLPPPPRTSRRPSTASNASSTRSLAEKHHSILRKPSFLDIGDEDDGRPSLEHASEAAAPGFGVNDRSSLFDHLIAPTSRSRSATVSSNWTSSTLSTSRPTSRPTSRQHTPITSRQPTPTLRDTAPIEDSFLDMGKLSLDTIRSEDEEINPPAITVAVPRPSPKPWNTKNVMKSPIGAAF